MPSGTSVPEDLCEEVLFWGAKQIDGDTRDGTRFTSASGALDRWGQPREELWPYDELRDLRSPSYRPPDGALDVGACIRGKLRSVRQDVAVIRAELEAGQPVVLGIPIWAALYRGSPEPLPAPSAGEILPTRHAIAIVGHDDDRAAILVRNSWGRGWANDGHLWISDTLLSQAFGAWAID